MNARSDSDAPAFVQEATQTPFFVLVFHEVEHLPESTKIENSVNIERRVSFKVAMLRGDKPSPGTELRPISVQALPEIDKVSSSLVSVSKTSVKLEKSCVITVTLANGDVFFIGYIYMTASLLAYSNQKSHTKCISEDIVYAASISRT